MESNMSNTSSSTNHSTECLDTVYRMATETITVSVTRTIVESVELDLAMFRKVLCRKKKDEDEGEYLKRLLASWTALRKDVGDQFDIEEEGEGDENELEGSKAEELLRDHKGEFQYYIQK